MMVAILADGLVVRCASLGPTVAAPSRRRTRFCPNTVDVFAWPMDQYDLTSRSVRSCLPEALQYLMLLAKDRLGGLKQGGCDLGSSCLV